MSYRSQKGQLHQEGRHNTRLGAGPGSWGQLGRSKEEKLQLGPDGPGPGDSKGASGEQRSISSEGWESETYEFREVKWRGVDGPGKDKPRQWAGPRIWGRVLC